MPQRDHLTYDLDENQSWPRALNRNRLTLLALLAVVVVLAVVLTVWMAGSTASSPGSTSRDVPAVASSASSSSGPVSSSASSSPLQTGSDAGSTARLPEGSETAARQFIAAWLEREPKARKAALHDTAAPGLAEQLTLTSKANIPKTAASGTPELKHASTYSVRYLQQLNNGTAIHINLVSDPQAPNGWVATSVEEA